MEILLWTVAIYLVIGILVTVVLSQTPYSANGWLLLSLLWPLFLYGFVTGAR